MQFLIISWTQAEIMLIEIWKGKLQTALKKIYQEWWNHTTQVTQEAADRNDTKGLYSYVKEVYVPKSSLITPVKISNELTQLIFISEG